MTNLTRRITGLGFALLAMLAPSCLQAEDIDLFVGRGTSATDAPNLLIILDNTANWGPESKFQAQKDALIDAFAILPDNSINVGLMMFTESGGGNSNTDGAYVRAAIRPLDAAYKAALAKMLNGNPPASEGLDVNEDASNSGKAGLTMAEAYLYFNGGTGTWEQVYAGNNKNKADYAGNTYDFKNCCSDSHDVWALPGNALATRGSTVYNSPVDPNACADNFILFIGNGPAQDSSNDITTANTILQNQTGISSDLLDAMVNGLPYTGNLSSRINPADEWAYFMQEDSPLEITTFAIDVQVYSNANQCSNNSAQGWSDLMRNMSEGVGGGEYYKQCGDTFDANQFSTDLGNALDKILSRNSVFASVALPAAANEQSTFLNQVYIGQFRPDVKARPRWFGNLKQYRIGIENDVLKVVDANGNGLVDTTNTESGGFIQGCARSYWTPVSESGPAYYWDFFDTDGDTATELTQNCNTAPAGSNTPDGFVVEKGGQAYTLRSQNPNSRDVYTCDPALSTCNSGGLTTFDTNNGAITDAALDANDPSDGNDLINWAIGYDVDDEDGDNQRNEMRPSVHLDIVHAQPVAVDYAGDPNNPEVVVFYGANDGVLRAINGNQSSAHGGKAPGFEFWAYLPPEFYGAIKRLRVNEDTIRFPASGPTEGQGSSGDLKDYGMDGPLSAYNFDYDGNGTVDERTLFAGVRRAGRLVYSFDITSKTAPALNWKLGCPNPDNDTNCTSFDSDGDSTSDWVAMGQSWSRLSLFYAEGHDPDMDNDMDPLIIMGGGYDDCEDEDDGLTDNNDCSATKGNIIYVLDAESGDVVKWFPTDRSVPGAVIVVPISDDDPRAMFAYAADTGGNVYRISGANGTGDPAIFGSTDPDTWIITKIASLGCNTVAPCDANRKFLFGPDVIRIPSSDKIGVLIGSGDREKPLIDYSVTNGVQNYFYSLVDQPLNPAWLDDTLDPNTPCGGNGVICNKWLTTVGTGDAFDPTATISEKGWKLPLRSGEQVVTGAITIDNIVNFSTHIPTQPQQCESDYGEATAYRVNYLDAEGDTTQFIGGGLVPTPVAGKVLIDGEPVPFCIGCGDEGSPIGAGKVGGGINWTQPRSRVWWNIDEVDN